MAGTGNPGRKVVKSDGFPDLGELPGVGLGPVRRVEIRLNFDLGARFWQLEGKSWSKVGLTGICPVFPYK